MTETVGILTHLQWIVGIARYVYIKVKGQEGGAMALLSFYRISPKTGCI